MLKPTQFLNVPTSAAWVLFVCFPVLCHAQDSGRLQRLGVDSQCSQEAALAANRCNGIASETLMQCSKDKLSPNCLKQIDAPRTEKKDESCMKAMEGAAAQCMPAMTLAVEPCLQATLSSKCKLQIDSANEKIEKWRSTCADAMKNWSSNVRLCNANRSEEEKKSRTCYDMIPKPVDACNQ